MSAETSSKCAYHHTISLRWEELEHPIPEIAAEYQPLAYRHKLSYIWKLRPYTILPTHHSPDVGIDAMKQNSGK